MERQQLQRRSRLGARARVSAQRPKSRGLVNSARVLWGRNYTCEVTDSDAVIRGMTLGSSKRRPRIGHTFWPSADEIDRRGCSPSRSADDAIAIQSSRMARLYAAVHDCTLSTNWRWSRSHNPRDSAIATHDVCNPMRGEDACSPRYLHAARVSASQSGADYRTIALCL